MKFTSIRHGLVACGLLVSMSLTAAETTDPVIVSATRTAQTADASLAPVIVIDQDVIERNPGADVADLLGLHAGVEVGRNGGRGQVTSLFIRGTESNHTLVMIDGVRINPGTIGGASIQNIDTSIIERIEVVRGPRSTLYGSDAIGGVINIITKRVKDKTTYSAAVGGGRYNTKQVKASIHHGNGGKGAGINISKLDTDGFPTRTTATQDRGYDNLSVQLYGKRRVGKTDLEISHWQSEGTTEYFDFFLTPIDQDYKNITTALSIKNNFTDRWSSEFKISKFKDEIQQNQSADFATTIRHTLDWQNDFQIGEHNLLSGGLFLSQEDTDSLSFGTVFDEDTTVSAQFIQNQFQYGPHNLITGIRDTHHESFGDETTWNVEYGFAFNKQFKIIAAANTGFRAPDSTDRFGFGGNPNLKPEESRNKELTLRFRSGNEAHRFYVTYFENEITNLINSVVISTSPFVSMNQNIDNAEIKGTEVGYDWQTAHWQLKVAATFQDPIDKTTDEQLGRRAKQIYNYGVSYRHNTWNISLGALYQSKRQNSSFDTIELDSYTLVNLSTHVKLSDRFSMNARIENLTDQEYQLASGFQTAARSVFLEFSYATTDK